MAVKYKVKKFKHGGSASDGKYFARATTMGEMNIFDVAEEIEKNCSLKSADVLGVITELVDVMTAALQDSKRVRLNGLGTFKMGLRSKLKDTPEEVVSNNKRNFRILFTPEYKRDDKGRHIVRMTENAKAVALDSYKAGVNDNKRKKSK